MGARKIAETASEGDLVREVSRVISGITGVVLGEKQRTLVAGRLAKRMRDLKITNPLEYARHLNKHFTAETSVLISLLTTHHTFFFREFQHFEYMLKVTLPMIVRSHREKGEKVIRVWSAACSRGQEVYSLAMYLKHHLPQLAPEMTFEILGSDVCEESVAIAENGVYSWEELRATPTVYMQNNWKKGTGDIANYVRAKDDLRKHVAFRILNLMELNRQPFGPKPPQFDIIFCRNVFIYFTQEQVRSVSVQLANYLQPMGQLFVGLSETLSGLNLPLEWIGPSVFAPKSQTSRANVVPLRPKTASAVGAEAKPLPPPQPTKILRVLCVDDSPTVLLLLKRILTKEKGFEIIGTAGDGQEASEKARALRPDLITLDIHMPKMSGVEFLDKYHKELKIPVVVVSSVPREDASLAFRCLELGAADYIEKPSVQNLEKVEEELHFKLRVAAEAGRVNPDLALDASFRKTNAVVRPDGKLRVIVVNFAAREALHGLLYAFRAPQPPTMVLVEGAGDLFAGWAAKMAEKTNGGTATVPASLMSLRANSVTFVEFDHGMGLVERESGDLGTSCLVFGPLTPKMESKIEKAEFRHIILEDRGRETSRTLTNKARLVVPITSFAYESDRFFAELDQKSQGGKK